MIKNKICAVLMLALGLVPVILDHDATVLVFMSPFAVPMLLSLAGSALISWRKHVRMHSITDFGDRL